MADENLLKMAEQKFQSAAEKIAKDLIATCHKQPQTHADRIRAMDDEELGRFLAEVENRRSAAGGGAIWKGAAHAIQWLKQPAEV